MGVVWEDRYLVLSFLFFVKSGGGTLKSFDGCHQRGGIKIVLDNDILKPLVRR